MNLRVQHYPPAAKPFALFGDRFACLSDARLDYFYRELDFENADHFHVSRDWIALLSVERPYNARSVNGHLMDSVRDHAVQMAIFFVRDFDWLFDLAHNYRTPLKTMGEAYDSLPHSEKKAAQQGPSLVSLCLFLGHSNQSSNSIRSRTQPPRSATIAGGVIPRASGTSFNESLGGVEGHARTCDAPASHSMQLHRPPVQQGLLQAYGRVRKEAGIKPCPRDLSLNSSQPLPTRGQLASGDFIVIARLVFQRAYSLRSNKVENSTTDTAKALPGIVDGSVYRFGPHGQHQTMKRFENVQKVSEGSYV